MKPETYYYAIEPLDGGPVTNVYRFYRDSRRWPDEYWPGLGWIQDSFVSQAEMDGALDLIDVTEDEALELARSLEARQPAVFFYVVDVKNGGPELLLRCHRNGARPAEHYRPGSGWIGDDRAWTREAAQRDIGIRKLSEVEALDLVRSLDTAHG